MANLGNKGRGPHSTIRRKYNHCIMHGPILMFEAWSTTLVNNLSQQPPRIECGSMSFAGGAGTTTNTTLWLAGVSSTSGVDILCPQKDATVC